MASPLQDREYITLSGYPLSPLTEQRVRDVVRVMEGVLQRLEARVEALQDAVAGLERRVKALEP